MNYISINNQKYELVEEPKCVYPPPKKEDKFFRVKLFLTGRRELSRCRDFRIYQISCDDLRYEKVTKSEKRDLIINELFD